MLLNLKRRRSGQVRAIDFVVSLLLFLLMLSQLILVIINVQTGLTSHIEDSLTLTELDTFGRSLLQEEGSPLWGYGQDLPSSFGLAESTAFPSLTLDASKIARLITGTSFPISAISGFEQFSYDSVKNLLAIGTDQEFQLSFLPLLEISMEIAEENASYYQASVTITNANNDPIEECIVSFFTLDLTTGNILLAGIETSDNSGKASNIYIDPNFNVPDGEHLSIAIAENGPLWGITWSIPSSSSEDILLGRESNATVWACGLNSTSLLVSDVHEAIGAPDEHFLSYIYKNNQGGFTNESITATSLFELNETISISNNGIVAFFSIIKTGDKYKVGIGTFPAILDSVQNLGNFYNVLGVVEDNPRDKTRITKDYPVYIRGTLMKCRITLWSD
ncbi:MAG: hypothetical protein ACXAC6_12245 [Candidatus Hodarchaeales archaeon]|jgi:hypothetical protein